MTRRREKATQVIGTRRAARELAFRILFESHRGRVDLASLWEITTNKMANGDDTLPQLSPEAMSFAHELVAGLGKHSSVIDERLSQTVRGWSFEQMAQTDLTMLRIATYEMTFTHEPHPPIIESAVRIGRKFGGDESGRFINGVLANISRDLQKELQKELQEDSSKKIIDKTP